MTTIGFLHTSALHVERFRSLITDFADDLGEIHVVDAGLLEDARRLGVDTELSERIEAHLRALAGEADVIVCTCSTLGEEVERLAGAVSVPVIRVDRPMAEAAVKTGRRLMVVGALGVDSRTYASASAVAAREPDSRLDGRRSVDQSGRGPAPIERHLKRVGDELGAHVAVHRPADDPAAEDVLDRGEIEPGLAASSRSDLDAFVSALNGADVTVAPGTCVGPFSTHPTPFVSGAVELYVAKCRTTLAPPAAA